MRTPGYFGIDIYVARGTLMPIKILRSPYSSRYDVNRFSRSTFSRNRASAVFFFQIDENLRYRTLYNKYSMKSHRNSNNLSPNRYSLISNFQNRTPGCTARSATKLFRNNSLGKTSSSFLLSANYIYTSREEIANHRTSESLPIHNRFRRG